MTTVCQNLISSPLKFLGATVLSFNTNLGLGSSESTLSVELIEDCEADPPDSFLCKDTISPENLVIVGDPVVFTAGSFVFGGILSGWSYTKNSGGLTYSVKISDPRQLLQNVAIIADSYHGNPVVGANYVNPYYYMEKILCAQFGFSGNTDAGTPYNAMMSALINIQDEYGPFICSPTCSSNGRNFLVDFTTFPGGINSGVGSFPNYFRLQGTSLTLQSILDEAADLIGCEYYTYLDWPENSYPIIRIGLISLAQQPTSFKSIIDSYNGVATDLSYGQELRNEVTKTVMVGENLHYLSQVDTFLPFFGIDIRDDKEVLVTPYGWDDYGFWINKNIDELNTILTNPFPSNGPYQISELDIRFAMAGVPAWSYWVFVNKGAGTFNNAIRAMFPTLSEDNVLQSILQIGAGADAAQRVENAQGRDLPDLSNGPRRYMARINKPEILEELEKVHSWLSNNLGSTFYGKQYLTPITNEAICYYLTDYTVNKGELVFSSEPVQSAWVDPGQAILGLNDPHLEFFRDEDGKIGGFALFSTIENLTDDLDGSDDKGSYGSWPTNLGPAVFGG